jgi:tripartite-type tricarboxylate transporter receptor subunit TctC
MRQIHAAALALAGLLAATSPALADDFYRGKSINFIIGYGPGGGVDSASRVIVRHLSRFIPGKPDIIPQNMEGAGGVIAGNHLGRRATADGLTIGLPGRSWFVEGVVKSSGVTFDPVKFSYVGSTGVNNTLLYVRGDLNISTPDELKKYPQKIPAAGIGAGTSTVTIPNMLAEYGYPLRVVLGYNSSARSLLALEQGEVGAYFTPEDSFSKRPDLVEKRVVVPILQSKRMVAGMPVLADIVPDKDQAVLSLFTAYDDTGLMVVGPPGIPTDRLEILRKAFIEMCNDADFRRDAATAGEPVGAPIPAPELEKIIARLAGSATPEVVSEYRRLGQAK